MVARLSDRQADSIVQAEGAIYETFDPDLHVVDLLPQMGRWLCIAVDYGTVNPFAGLLIGQGVDGRLYVAREYRHDSRKARRQKTDADYSSDLRDTLEQWRTDPGPTRPVDPSAASFMVQLHRDGWTGVTGAPNEGTPVTGTFAQLRDDRSAILSQERKTPVRVEIAWTTEVGQNRTSGGKRPSFTESVNDLIEHFYREVVQTVTPWQPPPSRLPDTPPVAVPQTWQA